MEVKKLCDKIRETAYAIHEYHSHGHLEKVYENALAHRLQKAGIAVKQQAALCVYDEDGTVLGEYYADLLVEDSLIVELKACRTVLDEHKAQLLGYLRASGIEHGLLINFGSYRFQIKKYALSRTGHTTYLQGKGFGISSLMCQLFSAILAFFCG